MIYWVWGIMIRLIATARGLPIPYGVPWPIATQLGLIFIAPVIAMAILALICISRGIYTGAMRTAIAILAIYTMILQVSYIFGSIMVWWTYLPLMAALTIFLIAAPTITMVVLILIYIRPKDSSIFSFTGNVKVPHLEADRKTVEYTSGKCHYCGASDPVERIKEGPYRGEERVAHGYTYLWDCYCPNCKEKWYALER